MKEELIVKIWKFCYMQLFDENGNEIQDKFVTVRKKHHQYECKKIFWRFYMII